MRRKLGTPPSAEAQWIQPDARGRIQLPKTLRRYPLFQIKDEGGLVQLIPFEAKEAERSTEKERKAFDAEQSELWRQPQVNQFFESKLKPKLILYFNTLRKLHPYFKTQKLALVLYGSRARGDALNTSDFDIAIFCEQIPPFKLRSQVGDEFEQSAADELSELERHQVSSDINFIFLNAKWETKAIPPIYFTVLSEGQVLVDPAGLVDGLQSKFKQFAKRSRLIQLGSGKSKTWKWKND